MYDVLWVGPGPVCTWQWDDCPVSRCQTQKSFVRDRISVFNGHCVNEGQTSTQQILIFCLQAFTTIFSIGHNWSLYLDAFNNLCKTENHSHVLGTRQQQLTEEVRPLGGYFFFFIFSLSIGDGVWCVGAAGSVHHHHRHHRHPWHQWSNKQGRKLPRCDSYLRNLKRLFTHRHKA